MTELSEAGGVGKKPMGLLRGLYAWTLKWSESKQATGVLGTLALLESSVFPIPPDILLIPMCLAKPKRAWFYATLTTLMSVLGGIAGYFVGLWLWQEVGDWFFLYVPGFTPGKFSKVQELYQAWGIVVVFAAGFSPIPYKIFTITSGVFSMSFPGFVLASLVGRGGRFFLVAGLVRYFGEPVKEKIERYFNELALIFCLLLGGGIIALKWLF